MAYYTSEEEGYNSDDSMNEVYEMVARSQFSEDMDNFVDKLGMYKKNRPVKVMVLYNEKIKNLNVEEHMAHIYHHTVTPTVVDSMDEIDILGIYKCDDISYLPNMKSLKILYCMDCDNMNDFNIDGFPLMAGAKFRECNDLTRIEGSSFLRILDVENCKNLDTIIDTPSLNYLFIKGCPKLSLRGIFCCNLKAVKSDNSTITLKNIRTVCERTMAMLYAQKGSNKDVYTKIAREYL
jgi:hypothetical protein